MGGRGRSQWRPAYQKGSLRETINADSHHFGEELDPNLYSHYSGKLDPDPHNDKSKKLNPDPH